MQIDWNEQIKSKASFTMVSFAERQNFSKANKSIKVALYLMKLKKKLP